MGGEGCYELKDAAVCHGAKRGILAKPTHDNIIRLAPPLLITEEQVSEALETFSSVLTDAFAGKNRLPDAERTRFH